MKKILILLAICFTILNTKAHVIQINICYPNSNIYNLCDGDTLRFTGDTTITACYGSFQCYVYNVDVSTWDFFYIFTSEVYTSSHDHIFMSGDTEYRGMYSQPGYFLGMCTTEIMEKNNSTCKFNESLYPNPADNYITIKYQFPKFEKATLNITDSKGILMESYYLLNDQNKIIISVSALNDGIYFYDIIVDNLQVISNKFTVIKQK